jgi:hypothetical protein
LKEQIDRTSFNRRWTDRIDMDEKEKVMSEESDREIPQDSFLTTDHLEVAAYYKWLYRGCPADDPLKDWVDARKELIQASR